MRSIRVQSEKSKVQAYYVYFYDLIALQVLATRQVFFRARPGIRLSRMKWAQFFLDKSIELVFFVNVFEFSNSQKSRNVCFFKKRILFEILNFGLGLVI